MPKRHKDFGSAPAAEEYEPLSFTFNGVEYHCRPAINGTVLLRFVREADSGEGGRSAGALLSLFKDFLLEEDYEAFEKAVEDPDTVVPVETLGEIAAWAVEQYTERPTKASSKPSGGRARTGTRAKAGASSQG